MTKRSPKVALPAARAATGLPPAASALALSDIGAWLGTLALAIVAMIVGLVRFARRTLAGGRTSE